MRFDTTKMNFLELLDYNPVIDRQQAIIFFNDQSKPKVTMHIIGELVMSGVIEYNEEIDCFYRRFGPIKNPYYLRRYIKAFWPIAFYGVEEVEFVYQGKYPLAYFFKTKSHGCFTSTFCSNIEDARIGEVVRETLKLKGGSDTISHIAVITNRDLLPDVKKYNYDLVALLNEKKKRIDFIE